jgi:hypothetical protein
MEAYGQLYASAALHPETTLVQRWLHILSGRLEEDNSFYLGRESNHNFSLL